MWRNDFKAQRTGLQNEVWYDLEHDRVLVEQSIAKQYRCCLRNKAIYDTRLDQNGKRPYGRHAAGTYCHDTLRDRQRTY